jgi:molecular chaperone GrpE
MSEDDKHPAPAAAGSPEPAPPSDAAPADSPGQGGSGPGVVDWGDANKPLTLDWESEDPLPEIKIVPGGGAAPPEPRRPARQHRIASDHVDTEELMAALDDAVAAQDQPRPRRPRSLHGTAGASLREELARVERSATPAGVVGGSSGVERVKVRDLERKLEKAETDRDDQRRRLGQMQAETVSFRKRLEDQAEAARSRGHEDAFRVLISLVDNLEAAVRSGDQARDFDKLHTGLQMVLQQFYLEFRPLGLSTFEATGQPFDPARHEAIRTSTSGGDTAPGTVTAQLRRGWLLGERLLRPATVVVEGQPPKD